MRSLSRPALAALTAVTAAPLFAAAPPAVAASDSVYQHGRYSQSHYATDAACKTARSKAIQTVTRLGGTGLRTGACHKIDAGVAANRQTGYLYDMTYHRSAPVWASDTFLGSNPATLTGAHSFLMEGSYATQAEAQRVEGARTASLTASSFGAKVTWHSRVKQNAITKKWEYHLTYNSRIPLYAADTEISQAPNVTLPSLGVTNPTPTKPTPDATNPTTKPVTPPTGDVTPTVPEKVGVSGIDISSHTVVQDWAGWKNAGVTFLYAKSTEGNYYKNPKWAEQYTGAYNNGIIRGSYHFAAPDASTGAQQADYFVNNGGGWSPDGKTLPGALDIEWNPYGAMCFGKTKEQMTNWIKDFREQYKTRVGIYPTIYTAKAWWNTCVGTTNTTQFATSPLWVAQYASALTALPSGWSKHTIWQNAAIDAKGYDTNIFNGTLTQLKQFAITGKAA